MSRLMLMTSLASILPLTGCGQYLGAYDVKSISLVPMMFLTSEGKDPGYGEYFQVDLTSATDITSLGARSVYADAKFCGARDEDDLVAFGPGDDSGRDLRSSDSDSPKKGHSDGRFHYRIYIVAAHPMPGVEYSSSWGDQQRYDLRTTDRDVCIRLRAPGYYLTPSRSRIIRVPARLFADAASTP